MMSATPTHVPVLRDRVLTLLAPALEEPGAVLVDATLVRALLFPAVLGLLGPAAWWGPRWAARRPEPDPAS